MMSDKPWTNWANFSLGLPEELSASTYYLTGAAIGLSFLYWWSTRRSAGLPPGPGPALPLLGHLHLLELDPRNKFSQWQRQYGDVFSLYMGNRLVVVLNGFPAIKEAFVKFAESFSDRPHTFITDKINKGLGVIASSGAHWKEQRKASLEILRELGMGKNVLAEKIQEEVGYFIQAVEDTNEKSCQLHPTVKASISNNICSIIFGKRFDYNDPSFVDYLSRVDENLKNLAAGALANFFPWLEHVPGDFFKIKKILSNVNHTTNTFIKPQIQQHIDDYTDNDSTDFIHCYLREISKRGTAQTTLDNDNLRYIIGDLFVAGTETTSAALLWTFLYFLHYPEVQTKCYNELVQVVGANRMPTMTDRPRLMYLEATIMEVLRCANIGNFGLAHTCLAGETKFRGFTIPPETLILPNLSSVFADEKIWGDPDQFRPERFIDSEGNISRPEEFIPFGIGRRICLGEPLARMELFLYLSALIQRFEFQQPAGDPLPSLHGVIGASINPVNFNICAILRK